MWTLDQPSHKLELTLQCHSTQFELIIPKWSSDQHLGMPYSMISNQTYKLVNIMSSNQPWVHWSYSNFKPSYLHAWGHNLSSNIKSWFSLTFNPNLRFLITLQLQIILLACLGSHACCFPNAIKTWDQWSQVNIKPTYLHVCIIILYSNIKMIFFFSPHPWVIWSHVEFNLSYMFDFMISFSNINICFSPCHWTRNQVFWWHVNTKISNLHAWAHNFNSNIKCGLLSPIQQELGVFCHIP